MNPNDLDGVPLEGAAEGEYIYPQGTTSTLSGASENTPTHVTVTSKRSKFPLWLLGLIPLLALGGFAATRFLGGTPSAETDAPSPLPKTRPRDVKASLADAGTPPKGAPPRVAAAPPTAMRVPQSKRVAGAPALSGLTVQKVAGGELVGMRRALEADGWTVHWLGKTREVRAWKALDASRKLWTEVRLTPATERATILQKGPKGRVLSTQNPEMSPQPRLEKGSVMAPSPLLQSATGGRFHFASDGTASLLPTSR